MKQSTSNPQGKNGKPVTLCGLSFEDALKKMLSTQPPKSEPKKKPAKRKA